MSGTFSVIVPTRDRPELLETAVRSVLAQTRPVEQIVVVDDGSEAECAAAVNALCDQQANVRAVRLPESRGVAAARNAGLDLARGDYVLFLDDDDLVHPKLCESAVERLEREQDAGAVVFGYETFSTPEARSLAHSPDRLSTPNPPPPELLERSPISAMLRYLIPIHSCVVRRREIGERRFPPGMRQGEDTYFWISLAAGGCRFAVDERVYAYVRRHGSNTTRSRRRYAREIPPCYEALLADGLLSNRADAYLAELKLLWFALAGSGGTGRTGATGGKSLRRLRRLLAAPDLLLREIAFWLSAS